MLTFFKKNILTDDTNKRTKKTFDIQNLNTPFFAASNIFITELFKI